MTSVDISIHLVGARNAFCWLVTTPTLWMHYRNPTPFCVWRRVAINNQHSIGCFIIAYDSSTSHKRCRSCCNHVSIKKSFSHVAIPRRGPWLVPKYKALPKRGLNYSRIVIMKQWEFSGRKLSKHSWISYISNRKLCHGLVLDASLSRRGRKELVLEVVGCYFPSMFGQDPCCSVESLSTSMDSVVDIYDCCQEDLSIPSNSFEISDWFHSISLQVECILFSLSFQRVQVMYESFSKMGSLRSFPIEIFCKYLFPGRCDLYHWIATGLVLKSMEQHFRRGPPGQGFIVESRARRRSKSLIAWKHLWESCWQNGKELSPYERGREISTSPFLCLDAVYFIGHLEQCVYERYLDKEARVILKSLNRPICLESARSLLEECDCICWTYPEEWNINYYYYSSLIDEEEIIRQRTTRGSCSVWNDGVGSFRSYCFDTKDSIALDDAISVEIVNEHYVIVSVHIIDVASYIPSGCPVDEEAKRREETLYMKNKTYHMLPPKLLPLLSFSTGKQFSLSRE